MKYYYTDGLESERLKTRFLTEADIKPWLDFFDSPEATQFLPDFGMRTPKERSEHWIHRQLMRYSEKRYGLQAVIDKNTNEFVGQCGLLMQDIDGKTEIEVGYHIFMRHWGKGYAPEAARLFFDFAFENELASSVVSIIDVNNTKSQRVADKNGLIRDKQVSWSGLEVFIYRLHR